MVGWFMVCFQAFISCIFIFLGDTIIDLAFFSSPLFINFYHVWHREVETWQFCCTATIKAIYFIQYLFHATSSWGTSRGRRLMRGEGSGREGVGNSRLVCVDQKLSSSPSWCWQAATARPFFRFQPDAPFDCWRFSSLSFLFPTWWKHPRSHHSSAHPF